MADAGDYVEAVLELLGGEDTEFLLRGTPGNFVQLACGYNGCTWGYLIGEMPLWEFVADAREHWDKQHGGTRCLS